ncbi:hypothetical protein Goklo_024132 [Gossypium klotzschianum]|uniref:Uncharacterized protein n=1 Tax=Gossypium klotzschianum TaxID=34286 RepID=A0A7J8W6C0_9ROSI|nr:hypothetical protein [Gossypium klotzschianum]
MLVGYMNRFMYALRPPKIDKLGPYLRGKAKGTSSSIGACIEEIFANFLSLVIGSKFM